MTEVMWFAAGLVLVFFLIKWALGMIKALMVGLLLGALGLGYAYFKGIGPFARYVVNVDSLRNNYCRAEVKDPVFCTCILPPIEQKLRKQFSQHTLDSISKEKVASLKLLHQTFKEEQAQIKQCMQERNDNRSPETIFYAAMAKSIGKPELSLHDLKDMILSDSSF